MLIKAQVPMKPGTNGHYKYKCVPYAALPHSTDVHRQVTGPFLFIVTDLKAAHGYNCYNIKLHTPLNTWIYIFTNIIAYDLNKQQEKHCKTTKWTGTKFMKSTESKKKKFVARGRNFWIFCMR